MSWGPCYLYYQCPVCGSRFKYALDMIPVLGERFGSCPKCHNLCIPEKEGAVTEDDFLYAEVED